VDRNRVRVGRGSTGLRSPPHGGVDRNSCARRIWHQALGRPHTGAWIETDARWRAGQPRGGRPHTGAWIETLPARGADICHQVAPTRGRGSKPSGVFIRRLCHASPPHGGVDRNDFCAGQGADRQMSPPHGGVDRNSPMWLAAPMRRRRPHTGAWIETALGASSRRASSGRPHTGAWIETPWASGKTKWTPVAPTRGRGSKPVGPDGRDNIVSSPPHGGVDRNRIAMDMPVSAPSRPHTGAWIET